MSDDAHPDAEINALLADLWQRHLPSLRERLDLLSRAAAAISSDSLDETTRADAQAIAHKLAGNLGMFGHQQAGTIAGQIEYVLKDLPPEALPQLVPLVDQLLQALAPYL
jgi:HPt (histidine-containing phosphotransfer) domain-containing protein